VSADGQARLAATPAASLLPSRRVDEAARISEPVRLVAQATLAHGIEYLLVEDARGVAYGVPAVAGPQGWRRAVAGDGAAEALVAALATETAGDLGLEATVFHAEPVHGERAIDVDQTNELVVVGGAAVVKWMLHPVAGEQPGPSRLTALAKAGFDGTPRTWGLVHARVADERVLIATVSDYLPGAEDGWDWAVRDVRQVARGERRADEVLDEVNTVARLVGRLHLALAEGGVDRATADEAAGWLAGAEADLVAARLSPELEPRARAPLASLGRCAGTPTIDVHGDLHIGQVLAVGDPRDYVVIDFDGNPTQDQESRLRRQPAARDVAGMLASWDHVGRVVLHRAEGLDDEAVERVLDWIERAQAAFLDSYRATLSAAGRAGLLDESLLVAMQVQQECREYAYAARYLPHWRYVPDAALPALLHRAPVETENP
jgi:maltokinase